MRSFPDLFKWRERTVIGIDIPVFTGYVKVNFLISGTVHQYGAFHHKIEAKFIFLNLFYVLFYAVYRQSRKRLKSKYERLDTSGVDFL